MPRKITRGTGITQHEITVCDVQKEPTPTDWGDGWNRALKEGGGLFGAVSLEALRTCEHIIENAEVIMNAGEGEPGVDTPEAFARRISQLIEVAKDRIDRAGNSQAPRSHADQAARFAFKAGVEWARATMKWAWEAEALSGQERARHLREASRRANIERQRIQRAQWDLWNQEANKIWAKSPNLSKSRVAALVKSRLEAPEAIDTISRRLNKGSEGSLSVPKEGKPTCDCFKRSSHT